MSTENTSDLPEKLTRRQIATYLLTTIIVVGIVLVVASRIVEPKNNQRECGQNEAIAHGVFGEPRDTLDVLFIGDSEAYCAFSPLQLWHEQGITSYVCATSAQKLPYTYQLLDQTFRQQRPKVVVLETNCLFRPFSAGYALTRTAKGIFPVIEYHNRWKSLKLEDLTAEPRATWTHPNKGFHIQNGVVPADTSKYMQASDELEPMPRFDRWYLEQIAQLCRDRGATLVLVSTPSTKNWRMPRHNTMKQVAAALGVDYIDLNTGKHRVDIDWQHDTCDGGDHLNLRGAQKTTTRMGEVLAATGLLPNRSNDNSLRSWNEAYGRYEQQVAKTTWTDGMKG